MVEFRRLFTNTQPIKPNDVKSLRRIFQGSWLVHTKFGGVQRLLPGKAYRQDAGIDLTLKTEQGERVAAKVTHTSRVEQ